MQKNNVYKFLFAVSAFLILGFALRFGIDAIKYDASETSAPLYAYALARAADVIQ